MSGTRHGATALKNTGFYRGGPISIDLSCQYPVVSGDARGAGGSYGSDQSARIINGRWLSRWPARIGCEFNGPEQGRNERGSLRDGRRRSRLQGSAERFERR